MADQEGGRVVVVVVAPGVVVVVVVTGTRTSQSTSRHEVAPVATVRSSFRVSAQRSARAAVHDSLLDARRRVQQIALPGRPQKPQDFADAWR